MLWPLYPKAHVKIPSVITLSVCKALLVWTVMGAVGLCTTARARTLDVIRASGTLIVATEGAYAPFNYFQDGRLTGFEVALGNAVAKKMGLAIEWKVLAFDTLLAGLQQDRWDLVAASFATTPERARAVTFTDPYYCSGGVIVTRDASLHSAASLAGKTVAVQTGSTYLAYVQRIPGIRDVRNFPQDTDARSALVSGRVDAWVSDRFVVKAALRANPKAKLHSGDDLYVEQMAGAVKKGNLLLAAAINQVLAALMRDGTYQNIAQQFLQEDARCK